jgi:hypothetical protein
VQPLSERRVKEAEKGMSTTINQGWTTVGVASVFDPNPLQVAPRRGVCEEQLERLKEQSLTFMLSSIESTALAQELRLVANEAAALAWLTVCPLLVLPTLLEEKVRVAISRWERQATIRHQQAGSVHYESQERGSGILRR